MELQEMLNIAHKLVEECERRDIHIRLIGSLAVTDLCRDNTESFLSERKWKDIDFMVEHRKDLKGITEIFTDH